MTTPSKLRSLRTGLTLALRQGDRLAVPRAVYDRGVAKFGIAGSS